MTEEEPIIYCCQGPPTCAYDGCGDVEAYMSACVWCSRTICHADGTETIIEPTRQ